MTNLDRLLRDSGVVFRHGDPATDGARRVFLHAGHLWVAREATEITTILGSCVAICLWDEIAGVGGMNHYMLPYDIGNQHASPRYARHATNMLLQALHTAGAEVGRLRARIYGGACILGTPGGGHDLGMENVLVARERLRAEKIPVVEDHTGGNHGRKIIYDTGTGNATVMKVSRVIR